MTGVLYDLCPVWVGDGVELAEAMSVKISVEEITIRIVNAYGPQEYDDALKKENFWDYLEKEVKQSDMEGSGIMIFLDANAWLGPSIIPNDPHTQNKNGELFYNFLERNDKKLAVLNSQEISKGLITRSRKVKDKVEESVIDFVVVCDKVLTFVEKFVVDEDKVHVLSNYSKKNKTTNSDHNSLITELNINFKQSKPERKTVFNFRDEAAMKKFKEITTVEGRFTKFFEGNKNFEVKVNKWKKELIRTIYKCFDKVRLNNKREKSSNFCKRKEAIRENNPEAKDSAEENLRSEEAENNIDRLMKNIQLLKKTKGTQNTLWNLKKKLFLKKKPNIPVA